MFKDAGGIHLKTVNRLNIFQMHWTLLWLYHMACVMLIPWPGIEPAPSAVKAQNPKHWQTPGKSQNVFDFKTCVCGANPLETYFVKPRIYERVQFCFWSFPMWREKKAGWRRVSLGELFSQGSGESQFHTKLNHHLHRAQNIFKAECRKILHSLGSRTKARRPHPVERRALVVILWWSWFSVDSLLLKKL